MTTSLGSSIRLIYLSHPSCKQAQGGIQLGFPNKITIVLKTVQPVAYSEVMPSKGAQKGYDAKQPTL